MPNKHYRKGYRFELKVKKYLESKGFLVFRTAGSHSVADLIALKPLDLRKDTRPMLIQCKAGTTSMSKNERTTLYHTAVNYNALPFEAYQNKKRRLEIDEVEI